MLFTLFLMSVAVCLLLSLKIRVAMQPTHTQTETQHGATIDHIKFPVVRSQHLNIKKFFCEPKTVAVFDKNRTRSVSAKAELLNVVQ